MVSSILRKVRKNIRFCLSSKSITVKLRKKQSIESNKNSNNKLLILTKKLVFLRNRGDGFWQSSQNKGENILIKSGLLQLQGW